MLVWGAFTQSTEGLPADYPPKEDAVLVGEAYGRNCPPQHVVYSGETSRQFDRPSERWALTLCWQRYLLGLLTGSTTIKAHGAQAFSCDKYGRPLIARDRHKQGYKTCLVRPADYGTDAVPTRATRREETRALVLRVSGTNGIPRTGSHVLVLFHVIIAVVPPSRART
jgi:hypothetical protein